MRLDESNDMHEVCVETRRGSARCQILGSSSEIARSSSESTLMGRAYDGTVWCDRVKLSDAWVDAIRCILISEGEK